ncbi:MAG: FAD-dependent oxidoreductase [bacterium]|nr:FAD-dependent oxidoreductase [bacterium]
MNKKVVILGAGLSGLNCARQLSGVLDYGLYEKENTAGGLCRTVSQDGFLFDYTGHLLHLKNPAIKTLVKSLLRENLCLLYRHSWIYSHQTYTRYPFQSNTHGLPASVIKECVLGFIKARIEERPGSKQEEGFYDWVLRNFGRGIGKHFMFGYNEKLWTVPAKKLTAEWLGKYVPKPTPDEVITGALLDQTRRVGYNASFYYPRYKGIQALPDALAHSLPELNLLAEASQINLHDKVVKFSSGLELKYEHLVSSISLKELTNIIEDWPSKLRESAAALKYNEVLNINLGVKPGLPTNKHWIYFPEKKYPFYRVGYSSNFSRCNHPAGTSSLYVEIACKAGTLATLNNKQVDRLVNESLAKLRQIGILQDLSQVVALNILKISPAYCLYDFNRTLAVNMIRAFLKSRGVYSIGRYGAWEYSAMEDALEWGRSTAELIKSSYQ